MKLERALPPASTLEAARVDQAWLLGCIVCRRMGLPLEQHCGRREYHHLNLGGMHGAPQLGHRFGFMLGAWHHQGRARPGWTVERMQATYGPNLRDDKRGFHARFGTDQALLNDQDDAVGWLRVEIPTKRQRDPRKPSATSCPTKRVPRRLGTI